MLKECYCHAYVLNVKITNKKKVVITSLVFSSQFLVFTNFITNLFVHHTVIIMEWLKNLQSRLLGTPARKH